MDRGYRKQTTTLCNYAVMLSPSDDVVTDGLESTQVTERCPSSLEPNDIVNPVNAKQSDLWDSVDPLERKYKCALSDHLLREPRQTPCGYRVSSPCVGRRVTGAEFQCPAGDEDCSFVTPDKFQAKVWSCRPASRGQCEDLDLGSAVSTSVLTEFIMNEEKSCKHLPIIESQEQLQQPQKHQQQHQQQQQLQHRQQRSLQRTNQSTTADHQANYSASLCNYNVIGCHERGTAEELAIHDRIATGEHLELMLVYLVTVNLEIVRLRGTKERLMEELDVMKMRMEAELKDKESLQRQWAAVVDELKLNEKKNLKQIATLNEKLLIMEEKISSLQSISHDLDTAKKRSVQLNDKIRQFEATDGKAALITSGLQTEVESQNKAIAMHDVRIADLALNLQCVETTNYEGQMIWKISDYSRRRREACSPGGTVSLFSQPFFTSRYGYKMCARIYLNGDGAGKGSHVSLFFVIMQGDYDDILSWPFSFKVTMTLLDQRNKRRHLSDSFRPDPNSSSFKKPTAPMNVASGCPLFVAHRTLEMDDTYIRNDAIYFRISVDTSETN